MKRIASYLIALATMAFTFTSCEDVPSPFGEIVKPSGEEKIVVEPSGSGTEKDPYNVAAVIELCSGLASGEQTDKDVYVKGTICEVKEVQTTGTYGNATYWISDDADGKANKFYIYRGYGLGGKKFTEGATPVQVGDKVVIKSVVMNYNGTYETAQNKCIIVELNGVKDSGSGGGGGGDTPTPGEAKGSGTQADPYNAAGANNFIKTLAADKESDKDIYIKGKLVKYADKGEFSKDFGNASFYLSDDGKESSEQFYVFRTLYLGNVKYTSGDTPKVGDEIIICGKVVNYKGNTPETVANKSYIYSWNGKTEGGGGGGSDTPSGDAKGTGTQADPFNVAAAIAKCKETGETATTEKYYIKGIADEDYTVNNYKNIEVNIVDVAGSADKFKVFRCKAADSKDIKEGFKVKKGDEIIVYGPVVNYKGNTPETATGAYVVSVNGKAPELDEGGSSGGGGESGGGSSAATSLTNGDFETWGSDGLPTGWKSASTASSATLEKSTDAHGGSFSCNVKGDEGNNKRLASQEITLAAGTYVFSAWVKATTSDVSQARLGYVPIGADGKAGSYAYADYANLSTSWQQFTQEFTLDSEKTICLVIMNPKKSSYSSGKDILVDDATLTKK